MEDYKPYPCKMCGRCCRQVHLVPEMYEYNRGDGVCIYLQTNNKCQIYEKRPNLCNGKYVYEHSFSHMTVVEFHRLLGECCKKIQEDESGERLS